MCQSAKEKTSRRDNVVASAVCGNGVPSGDGRPRRGIAARISGYKQPSPVGRGCPAMAFSPAIAGRVRGSSLIMAPPESSPLRQPRGLCLRILLDPPPLTRWKSAPGGSPALSNSPLSQRLCASGSAESEHHHPARSPVDVRSSRNPRPSFRCDTGGETSHPAFGRATDTMRLFRLWFGCAAISACVGSGCAQGEYHSIARA